MKKDVFSFTTSDNLTLPGLIYTPEVSTKEVAILLHGNGSSSVFYSMEKHDPVGKQLTDMGITFVAFNNRGAHYHKKFKGLDGNGDKRQKSYGTAFELLKECIIDIDDIVEYLRDQGYEKFHLIGNSTGSNKICVYNRYKEKTLFHSYLLAASGDDTGVYHHYMGGDSFMRLLNISKEKISQGEGESFVPREEIFGMLMSYQSLYDTINPDGDYNTFPYNEYINKLELSTKPLFRYFQKIKIPTSVIYGELDEYCGGSASKAIEILKQHEMEGQKINYQIIPGADHGLSGYYDEFAKAIGEHFSRL